MIIHVIYFCFISYILSLFFNISKIKKYILPLLTIVFMIVSNKTQDISTYLILIFIALLCFKLIQLFNLNKNILQFIPFLFSLTVLTYAHTHTFAFASGLSYICLITAQSLLKQNLDLKSFAKYQFQNVFVFPKLLVGPIDPIDETSSEKIEVDFRRIVIGIIKVLIFLPLWRQLRHDYDINSFNWTIHGISTFLFIGVWHYVDLYFEFSGAIDIVIPTLNIYGIKPIENFNKPYLATSIENFWRRWHMSLGLWLTNHLYIPLGGNRKGFILQSISIFTVMLASSVWHGIGLNFIFWGSIQATCIILNKRMRFQHIPKLLKWLLTQLLVVISWVVFFEFK